MIFDKDHPQHKKFRRMLRNLHDLSRCKNLPRKVIHKRAKSLQIKIHRFVYRYYSWFDLIN